MKKPFSFLFVGAKEQEERELERIQKEEELGDEADNYSKKVRHGIDQKLDGLEMNVGSRIIQKDDIIDNFSNLGAEIERQRMERMKQAQEMRQEQSGKEIEFKR